MENQLQLFENEQFGKIRVIMINGEPWFVAADVCKVLELNSVSKAIERLGENEKSFATIPARGMNNIPTRGGEQKMLIINEPGLYKLIFTSRKKEAIDFQNWVYHDVLPSIRKTGNYSLNAPEAAPIALRNSARSDAQKKDACVYALEMSDGTVKIGQSSDVRARVAKIERQTGLTVKNFYITPFMPREEARFIEWACQKTFSSRRVKGEIFSIAFNEACAVIDSFAKVIGVLPTLSKSERGDKLLSVASLMVDSPEKQRILIKTANLFVGKKFV